MKIPPAYTVRDAAMGEEFRKHPAAPRPERPIPPGRGGPTRPARPAADRKVGDGEAKAS